jgi:CRP-like cAMP-binding protein
MVLHRKHLQSEKKKSLVAASLAKKIGYLKITDIVPSGIVEHLETQSFNPHRIISPKNKFFLIKEGSVEIWHTHYDKLVKTLGSGMLFGNMPLLGQVMIGTKSISGTEGTIIAEVTIDIAKEWLKANPLGILEWIGTRLSQIEVEHYRAAFQLADSRVSALLLELANDDLVVEGLSHEDLALRIGLYRETVTHVLSVMKQDRLVKVGRERITILDKRALQELSEF